MSISPTLHAYLKDKNIEFDVLYHQHTGSSSETAQASHIPGNNLAKGVVLSREGGFTLAVVPASCHVKLDAVGELIPGPIRLASEEEIESIFPDCEVGAVPPIGAAYGIDVIVDESLEATEDIYFEAGDHESLIHVSSTQFHATHEQCPHGKFSEPI